MRIPSHRFKTLFRLLATAGALLALSAPASADLWKHKGGDCDSTAFRTPETAGGAAIRRCVRLFEAYRSVKGIEAGYKDRVIAAMRLLYNKGNDADAHVARIGLDRLGVTVPAREYGAPTTGGGGAKVAKVARTKFATCPGGSKPPVPEKKDKKKAKKVYKKGMKAYKEKNFEKALSIFKEMVDIAPGWSTTMYNNATMHSMTGDKDGALGWLWCMRDVAREGHLKLLKSARKDSDFISMRRDDRFKEVTGYAKTLIIDTLPDDLGADNTDNLKASLETFKQTVIKQVRPDLNKTRPYIFYRAVARNQAYIYSKVMNHPKVVIKPMPAAKEDEGFDIVILWGDKLPKDGEPTLYVQAADESQDFLKDVQKTEDQIMAAPDDFEKEIDSATSPVTDTYKQGENTYKKAEDTIDKGKDTVDKAGKIIKSIGF